MGVAVMPPRAPVKVCKFARFVIGAAQARATREAMIIVDFILRVVGGLEEWSVVVIEVDKDLVNRKNVMSSQTRKECKTPRRE
jgi:hypothetical protein